MTASTVLYWALIVIAIELEQAAIAVLTAIVVAAIVALLGRSNTL